MSKKQGCRSRAKAARELAKNLTMEYANSCRDRSERGCVVRMTALYEVSYRRCLNPIVFCEQFQSIGLSLAALLSLPNEELVGVVPDSDGLRVGDTVTVLMHHRDLERTVKAVSLCITDGLAPVVFRFNREILGQFGMNGRVDFFYEVRSASGDLTVMSPKVPLSLMIHCMPERLFAPVVVTAEHGIVRDADMIPYLAVKIPAGLPACKGGDRLRMRIGDAWFQPITLGKLEVGLEPMMKFLVPCEDLLRLAASHGTERFEAEVSYDIDRDGVISPSAFTTVLFDLTPAEAS